MLYFLMGSSRKQFNKNVFDLRKRHILSIGSTLLKLSIPVLKTDALELSTLLFCA